MMKELKRKLKSPPSSFITHKSSFIFFPYLTGLQFRKFWQILLMTEKMQSRNPLSLRASVFQVLGACGIAGGVNNMPEGHLFVCNLGFVIWNFPRRGPKGHRKAMMNYEF
jgi:hypothetical protein